MRSIAPRDTLQAPSHYGLVAPVMQSIFGAIPLVWTAYPFGPDRAPQWHAHYFGRYETLSASLVEKLVHIGAQEFYSWFPTPRHFSRARFMRMVLYFHNAETLKQAATTVREMLREEGREALCLLDGLGNIELWSPVSGAPTYDAVRDYLHHFSARVIEKHGSLISAAPNTHDDGRVHLHVSNNAVGRWTVVPYSYRPQTRRVATPIAWTELARLDVSGCAVDEFAERFAAMGDVFAKELGALPSSPPLLVPKVMATSPITDRGARNAHGAVLQAAIQLLQDGKARTAAQIESDAVAAGLINATPASTVDATLLEYIARCKQRGRKCIIVETEQRAFRLNEPPDEWPLVPIAPLPPLTAEQQTVMNQLRASAQNDQDGRAFEIAVCDAFNALSFAATHLGGWNAPDGYLDAQLGPLGYRVMLECKSGHAIHSAGVYEAAKYNDAYNAQYCLMVGSDTVDDHEVLAELQNHGVSAWAVDDFELLFRLGLDAVDMEPMFKGGVVGADALMDLQWDRNHGERKRVRIVAEIIRSSAWAMQCASVEAGPPKDAPVLNVDAAMMLVDQALLAKGCKVSCTRAQVQEAFDYLTSPLVNAAVWDAGNQGIVIRSPMAWGDA